MQSVSEGRNTQTYEKNTTSHFRDENRWAGIMAKNADEQSLLIEGLISRMQILLTMINGEKLKSSNVKSQMETLMNLVDTEKHENSVMASHMSAMCEDMDVLYNFMEKHKQNMVPAAVDPPTRETAEECHKRLENIKKSRKHWETFRSPRAIPFTSQF